MMKQPFEPILILIAVLFSVKLNAQCTVVPDSSSVLDIFCGETIDLSVTGVGAGTVDTVDFNGSTTGTFTNTSTLLYSNPCGPTLDGTPAAWFGNAVTPRTLTSVGYDMSCGGQICFDFDFGSDDPCGCSHCEDPDLVDEGVYFQYSIDGGVSWVDIFYFQPNNTSSGPYYSWANYCFPVPPGAQTTNAMFRWHQAVVSGSQYDHWGVDNVVITPNLCGSYYYTWNGVLGDQDTTVTLTTTTNYDIILTNGVDDTCTTSILVNVNDFNVNLVSPTTTFNCGDCASMQSQVFPFPVIPGASYSASWSPPGFFNNPNTASVWACPQTSGWITTLVTEANSGCSGTDSVYVTVNPLNPGFNYPITELCLDDAPVTPTVTGTPGGQFSSGLGLSIDTLTGEINPTLSTPGVYNVTYVPDDNCPSDSTISITIFDLPQVNAGLDQTICPNDSVTLNGSGAQTYLWDNGVTDGVPFSPTTTQTYTVTGIDVNGCENSDQVQVVVLPNDDPSFEFLQGVEYCINDANPVANVLGTSGGVFSYTVITGGPTLGLDNLSGDIDLSTSNPGEYTVQYNTTVAGLCPDSSFIDIAIHDIPDAHFNADILIGCEPQTVSFVPNSTQPSQLCFWSFGDGNTSSDCNNVYNIYDQGIYDVTLTVTSEAGCVNSETYIEYIDVTAQTIANYFANPAVTNIENTEVNFTNTSVNAGYYTWIFGDSLFTTTDQDPDFIFPEVPDVYDVTLIAHSNDSLCSDTAFGQIVVNNILLYFVPNAFTPNGDDKNSVFKPVFESGFVHDEWHMTIFDRWGEIIFESYDYTSGWDGTNGSGVIVPDGVYIWQIEFVDEHTDLSRVEHGHVTVLK